ncbi:hypothetical protein H072_42 [Dactylellina haptotyla CBS 200.50]|uniref:Uncharacterized protein n=1 Tax=Dactylellina haptotyla (strain CBS 200.50) TaxID=1284197 RepID=S8ASJ8_DACHA|nr:hypothetical protein H072_42 [Dactylellina haptotyla CBS 200.50]
MADFHIKMARTVYHASNALPPMSRKTKRKMGKPVKPDAIFTIDPHGPSKRSKTKPSDGLLYNPELVSFDIYVDWRELLSSFLDMYDEMGLDSSSSDGDSSIAGGESEWETSESTDEEA